MSYTIIIKSSAANDIDEAFIWYENTLENLGFEFLLSFDATIESIKRNPQFAGLIYKNVRSATLMRFPYSICYTIDNERVIILAVFHHSRSPKHLKKRV